MTVFRFPLKSPSSDILSPLYFGMAPKLWGMFNLFVIICMRFFLFDIFYHLL